MTSKPYSKTAQTYTQEQGLLKQLKSLTEFDLDQQMQDKHCCQNPNSTTTQPNIT